MNTYKSIQARAAVVASAAAGDRACVAAAFRLNTLTYCSGCTPRMELVASVSCERWETGGRQRKRPTRARQEHSVTHRLLVPCAPSR